jgi:membrane-associated phospholipid phosphatase
MTTDSGLACGGMTRRFFPEVTKLAVIAAFFSAWTGLYLWTNLCGTCPGRAIHFDRPCDLWPGIIQPWTAVIYVFGGVLITLLPFLYHWQWEGIRFVLTAYAVSSAIAFFSYIVMPVNTMRPSFSTEGVGDWLMRWIHSVDNEANCCPSSHAIFAVLGALLVSRSRAPALVRGATWALAGAVCVTTITTGQHYFMDVLLGVVTAVVGYFLASRIWKGRAGPEVSHLRLAGRLPGEDADHSPTGSH